MESFYQSTICFVLFSFLGWVCETVYCSIIERKFVYRGFLNGPYCPIYGFGGLIVVFCLAPLDSYLLIFVFGLLLTSALEYVTSYLMEKLFNARWWDYSDKFLNINGRVCLLNSIMFGGLSVVAVRLLAPPFRKLVGEIIPSRALPYIAWLLLALFVADTAVTVSSVVNLNKAAEELSHKLEELKATLAEKQKERVPLSVQWEKFKADYGPDKQLELKQVLKELGINVEKHYLLNKLSRFEVGRLDHAFSGKKVKRNKNQHLSIKAWIEAENKKNKAKLNKPKKKSEKIK